MSGAMPECSKEFWKQGLSAYDRMEGIDWSWNAIDGTMTKAPPAADLQRRLFESEGVEFNISGTVNIKVHRWNFE